MGFNLALIVERVLTHPRGWEVEDLKNELGIADRTYRKYRQLLTEHFQPFQSRNGVSLLQEVEVGSTRYLRLVSIRESGLADADFDARVAAAHLSQRWFDELDGTQLGQAFSDLLDEFQATVRDRSFIRSSVFRDIAARLDVEPINWQKDLPEHIDRLVTAVVRKRCVRIVLRDGEVLSGNLEKLHIGRDNVSVRLEDTAAVSLADIVEMKLQD
jgi:hypothetical protein